VAATFDVDAIGDGSGVVAVLLPVLDGAGVVAVELRVGAEGVAADLGPAAVVVKLPEARGDEMVLGAHAATSRTTRAGARTMIIRRLRELFMTVPLRCIREPWMDPSVITFSPCSTRKKPPMVRTSPTSPMPVPVGSSPAPTRVLLPAATT
jgi:hypothetical protein